MKSTIFLALVLGILVGLGAETKPDVVEHFRIAGKIAQNYEDTWVYEFWLDDQGILTRAVAHKDSAKAKRETTEFIRKGNSITWEEVDPDNGTHKNRIRWSGLAIDWDETFVSTRPGLKDASDHDQIVASPRVGILWESDGKTVKGTATTYEEIARKPDSGFRFAPSFYKLDGQILTEWYRGGINGRYVYSQMAKKISAVYQQQMDTGAPWDEYGQFSLEGRSLHNSDPLVNTLNQLILEKYLRDTSVFLPSLWGWKLP